MAFTSVYSHYFTLTTFSRAILAYSRGRVNTGLLCINNNWKTAGGQRYGQYE